ncbi:alanine--glyoxylate aminotransferase family protein [Infirmifilum lucidum]|uniref:Alanine--glyoxylate aminotransferase family protein n=1 Tax=Infirmifilum lucidum TaxID=2776706 RepID=A0A7L9FIP4_9CREN|nr:aminotransferase class V-fold PLP-dependent enzyme [Infirmifilum lucidum]QOJ78776.1 alanine--glyoxylate aminotransferase family protein [Infirmifilum lucidum]
MKLLTPGPVQVPRRVLEALARQPLFHRSEEFRRVFGEVLENLSKLYPGSEPVVIPGTGTLAVDAMVYNYVEPGDKVLAVVNGVFGERLVEALGSRGAEVLVLESRPGESVPYEAVEEEALRVRGLKAIAVVHNETSTGVAVRCLDKLRDLAHGLGALLLVDSVSGFPAEPIPPGIDVIATASHKAMLATPGASILYVSAKPRSSKGVPPSMRLDKFIESRAASETPYTPPINTLYALRASTEYILEMGVTRYQELHAERAKAVYSLVRAKPLVKDVAARSRTVAAFELARAREAIGELASNGYAVAGGMGALRDRVVRVGLMGEIERQDLEAVARVLNKYAGTA